LKNKNDGLHLRARWAYPTFVEEILRSTLFISAFAASVGRHARSTYCRGFGFCVALACALGLSAPALAVIAVAQDNSSCPQSLVKTLSVPFTQAQTAGNLNYVAIGWIGLPRTILSVTDTKGNAYVPATTVKTGPNSYAQVIFYAKNIVAAAANANSVTVTFDGLVGNLDVRIAEYSGLSTTNALDVTAGASGTGTNTASGAVTTTNANDLLVGTNKVENSTTGPGSGFTEELSTFDGDILEYRVVSATGSYEATAPQDSSGGWIMQMVAFRAAGSPAGGDTQAPSAPSSFSATVTGGTPVNLSWSASTDNVGVTAYVLERCKGASCANFAQVAIPSGTSYSDTGLTASSSYTYRVRAIDAAGNLSTASTYTLTTPSITYVQGNYADPDSATSIAIAYPLAQTAGGLNIVAIAWSDATSHVTGVTDSAGNTYALAIGPTNDGVDTQSIYYAKNIGAASANTLTVTFNSNVPYPDVRIAEYSGLDTTTPLDQVAAAGDYGATATAGPMTTTSANEVIVGATYFHSAGSGAGSGYTLRLFTDPDKDVLEDKIVSATGSYSATAIPAATDYWVMSMATFRASAGGDTQAPTAPTNLTATAASSSQINLSWTGSTDNVGVVNYRVERCQGAGCSNFTQIGTPTSTTYSDTGLSASTSYSYRVRAADAVPNLSGYSNTASVTTQAPGDTQAPSTPTGLIVVASSSVEIDLAWSAATDNVGVTGYLIERCQVAGCSNFSQVGTSTGTTYNDPGRSAATSYSYRVRATDAANNMGGYSNTATRQTAVSSPDCN
jgi:chitodextrinase